MKTIVILCTYNGEKYIIKQLDSLKCQTEKNFEVCIIDDCSTDKTIEIVNRFIASNRLCESWKVYVNNKNVGWKVNFHNAIKNMKADYIYLCDQDDVWNNKKIEKMNSIMKANKNIGLLACSYRPLYSDNCTKKISSPILKSMKYDGAIKQIPLNRRFHVVLRPGCTYLVRGSFIDQINDFLVDNVAHDMNLWTLAILMRRAYFIDCNLISWRRHDDSASSPFAILNSQNRYSKILDNRLRDLAERNRYYQILIDSWHAHKELFPQKSFTIVTKEKKKCENLLKTIENRSLIKVPFICLKNITSYIGIKSFFADCAIVFYVWRYQKDN